MSLETSNILERLDRRHPGLVEYARRMAGYFGIPVPVYRSYLCACLERLPAEPLEASLQHWEGLGILPDLEVKTDEQVAALWQSPFFQAMLGAFEFLPPEDLDLRVHLPPRLTHPTEIYARLVLPYPGLRPYWEVALLRTFPELYLFPELDLLSLPIRGCDLACGWGRGTLSLGGRQGYEMHCCDLSRESLERLEAVARSSGYPPIRTVRCDITALPYPEDFFDFFLAFDIFEHLTDPVLDRVLTEVLRCGRPGAVLYAEIPLESYFPLITHLQNFHLGPLIDRFQGFHAHHKSFRLERYVPAIADQFTFRIVSVKEANPGMG